MHVHASEFARLPSRKRLY